ncbi:hypothetical protein [Xanthomonas arboricola]|uniref:hypothetical protein n=1 Tax=Xanthomonas arboricola TaxID=56448 RepID=UPI000CAA126A|nr:hypothetical protein [Xanthomonas arboricola]SOT93563.1 hypothetical protein CFBP6773_00246 [Xanthomonas arboricola pv. fragariae]
MDYFEEKSAEISVEEMTSFGVHIHTRYGKAWQMAEMLQFTTDLANLDLHQAVAKAFYDSKNNICNFELVDDEPPSEVSAAILKCAMRRITQFEWGGRIYHGEPMAAQQLIQANRGSRYDLIQALSRNRGSTTILIKHSDIEGKLEEWGHRVETEYQKRLNAGEIRRSDEMQSERDDIRTTVLSADEVAWAETAEKQLQAELDDAEMRMDPELNTQSDIEDIDALRTTTENLQESLRYYLP